MLPRLFECYLAVSPSLARLASPPALLLQEEEERLLSRAWMPSHSALAKRCRQVGGAGASPRLPGVMHICQAGGQIRLPGWAAGAPAAAKGGVGGTKSGEWTKKGVEGVEVGA